MRDTDNSTNEFVLGIAFLILGLIYTTILCFGFARFCKLGKNTKYLGIIFYFSILLSCLAYMFNMSIYLYNVFSGEIDIQRIEKQLLNTIYIPDAIFWIVYQSLFWTVVFLYSDSHIKMGPIIDQIKSGPKSISCIHYIFVLYGLTQVVIILLYNIDYLNFLTLLYINICVNGSMPVQFLIITIYQQFKNSGNPFRSKNSENRVSRLQKLVVFWTLMRIIQIISNYLLMKNSEEIKKFFNSELEQTQILFYVSFLIIDLLLSSIIPFILALRHQTVTIFGCRGKHLLMSNASEQPLRQEFKNDDSSINERNLLEFNYNELKKEGKLDSNKRQKASKGFGYIIQCIIKQKKYALRIIGYKQLQNYLVDQIKIEIDKINNLRNQYLYHIHGIDINNNEIIYLVKFYNKSLRDYMNEQKILKNDEVKEFLIQILRSIQYLHNQNIPHGQLTSTNIMLNKNDRIKLVDFGLFALKKYISLVDGYTNKSGYMAPELLNQRGQMINGTLEGDIYSIGMIMYEMFERKIPFDGLNVQGILDCVNKKIRPKIQEESMADIIRWCWQQEPEKRPKIDYIIVGSNIYNVEFVEDIFVYYGSPINDTDTIPYEENLFISKIKLDMPEYKFSRSERINIVLSIIRNGLHLIEYPIINDCTIMNTFELQYQNNLKSYPTLNFTKSERDQLSIILDVRKSYFSIQNCYQILESINSEPSQFFRNKYVLLRYPQKQMIVKIKSVIYDQEFTYKNMSLEEHFRTKYQLQSKHQVYLETYNTKNIKKQFLFAEFCDLQVDYIEQNITKYCEQLDYWNRILNNSSLFMNHLKNFKLIIQAYNVEYKQQYLEPGIMVFNNIQKSVQMMIGTRTTNEFEYYYGDFFLKDKTIFTTSLQINKLLIFVTRELIESREHFKSFLDQLDLQIKSRQYKIGQPKIFDVYHNLNDLITQYVTDDSYVLFVGDQCLEFQTARIELLKRGIPNQIILQPIQDQEVNRLLGKMTANIGSVPWSIKEITGYIGNKKTAVLGIQKIDDNNISACLSINKYLNKYISSFGETNQTIRMLIATYYATHKIFPEQLIIFSEEQFNQLIEQKILEIIQMIREQQLASQILKPEIISVIVTDAQQERYFTYHEKQFEPYYCRNPQIGIIIPIDEKNGKFTIHTQRGESGCIRAQSINISGNNYREILQLYYLLIFLNFDLSASSYLPAPLHYAKKLTRFQIDSSVYKKAIEKGLMLYV